MRAYRVALPVSGAGQSTGQALLVGPHVSFEKITFVEGLPGEPPGAIDLLMGIFLKGFEALFPLLMTSCAGSPFMHHNGWPSL